MNKPFVCIGEAGRPVWSVSMDPVEAGGPYTITASSADCALSLDDVMFGDVWICSGQSNMYHTVAEVRAGITAIQINISW